MAGKMKNCPMCGKLFIATSSMRVCANCKVKEQELEADAVNYVRDHPKSKISEIAEATGASENLIRRLIREGRFEQVGVKLTYPCEKCGAPIITGNLCAQCLEALQKELVTTTKKAAAAVQAQNKGVGIRSKSMRH